MIVNFNQIKRQPDPIFEGKIAENVVITGRSLSRDGDAYIDYQGRRFTISSSIHRETINEKKATQISDIMCGNERVGYVYPDLVPTKKIFFISVGYDYFVFNFNGIDYTVYEVGLGAGKHYFCVYRNDRTVAIIHKNDKKVNFCDQYTIYAEDNGELLPLSVLTLYFDSIKYVDSGEIMGEVHSDDSVLTVQKELIAKFDPEFIPKIISQDGYVL